MANPIRHMVSKKKRRYIQDGFDLDLSYITDHIIAMGFPADKVEGLYRNPIKQVKKFYEQKHADRYKLYNLCAERTYDAKKFHGRVSHYPFEDHNAPPVDLIVRCCKDIEDWLAADEKNIVGINCKAGKGRTGLIICCYLLHSKECKTTDEALTYYGHKRTHDGKGVTIASQQRYIRYYEKILQFGGIPPIRALYLNKLRVHTLPNFPSEPYLTVEMKGHIVFKTAPVKVPSSKSGDAYFDIDCSNTPVFGDVKIQLSCAAGNKTQNLCHFWFNTGFVDETNKVTLHKGEIDVANKDKKCVRFKSEFALEMMFEEIEGEHKGKVPQVVITEEDNPKSPSKKRRRIVSVVLNDNTVDAPKEVLVIDKTKKSKSNTNNNSETEPSAETETKHAENGHEEKPTEAGNGEKKPKDKKMEDPSGRNRGRSFYHYKEYSDEGKHAKDEDVSSTTSEEFQEYFESFEESNSTELVVQSNTNANARKDSATNLRESGKGTKNSPKPSKRASKEDDSAEGKVKSPRTKSKTDVRTESPRTKSKTDVRTESKTDIRASDSPRKKDDDKPADGAESKKDKKDKKDKKGDKTEKTDKPAEPVVEKKDEPKTLQVNDGDKTTKRKGSKKELKNEKKDDKKDDVKAETHGEGKKDEPSEQVENKDVKKVKGDSTPKGSPKPEKKPKEDKKAEKEKKKQEEKDEKEKKKQEEKDEKEKKKQEEKDEKEKKKLDDKKGKKTDKDDKPAEEKEEVSSPKSEKKIKEDKKKHDDKETAGPESKKPEKKDKEDKKKHDDKENGVKEAKDKKDKENGAAHDKKDDKPAHDKKDDKAAHDKKDDKAAHDKKDDKVAHDKKDDKAAHDKKDDKAAHDKKDDKVAHDKKDDKPAEPAKKKEKKDKTNGTAETAVTTD